MKYIIYITVSLFLIYGCSSEKQARYYTLDGFAQGSTYHFVFEAQDTTGIQSAVDSLFAAVDNSMSFYVENSRVNRLNNNLTDTLDTYITECIEMTSTLSQLSDGLYDITIKPVTQAWGFTAEKATENPNIDSLMQYVGYQKISVDNGRLKKSLPLVQIDLSSIAQGYTADLLGRLMESRGIANYLVEIGGEIFCRGVNAKGTDWVVGIDKPIEGNYIPGADMQVKLRLSGRGLATSGNYRKFRTDSSGRKIVHIINAKTGMSEISNLLSATVVAENAAMADAYGTLLMIMGLEPAKEFLAVHPEIDGLLVYTDPSGNFKSYCSPALEQYIVKE